MKLRPTLLVESVRGRFVLSCYDPPVVWLVTNRKRDQRLGIGRLSSIKVHSVNLLGFVGHRWFLLQLLKCHRRTKAAIDCKYELCSNEALFMDTEIWNAWFSHFTKYSFDFLKPLKRIDIIFYSLVRQQAAGHIWPPGCSLPTPALE